MAQRLPNPYNPSSAAGRLYELFADQQWHSRTDLQKFMDEHFPAIGLDGRLAGFRKDGLLPAPGYPAGRWAFRRAGNNIQLTFRDKIEAGTAPATVIDDEKLRDLVQASLEEKLGTVIDELVAERTKKLDDQIKKLEKTNIPILELHHYESPTKVKVETMMPAHKSMKKLAYLVGKGHHVYLYGDPGSGKSTAAAQLAKAMKRSFGYISLTVQTMDSRIMGFMSPNGKYVETEFFRCYTQGGIFCIDEMDNASGNFLTMLNSCLENSLAAFPHGMFERHKNFVVVATGNTHGGGPNPMFPERRPFDKAFAERFTYLEWTYDEQLESSVASGINKKLGPAWVEYVQKLRAYCKANHPKLLVSPRVAFKGAEYLKDADLSAREILDGVLFKGLESATKESILRACPIPTFKPEVA